jgi:hypothetical protein
MRAFVLRVCVAVCLLYTSVAAWSQTGDSVVDSFVTPYYEHRNGGTAPPSVLQPSTYGPQPADLTRCGIGPSPPAHESSCPSDITYVPNVHTGGYQAFGIGLHNYPYYEDWIPECEMIPYPYWDGEGWSIEWVMECTYHHVVAPAEAGGPGVSRIQFGANTVTLPHVPDVGQPAVTAPISTLAFKGSHLQWCSPTYVGPTAPCVPAAGTYVPGAGYEDKITMPDNCSLSTRTGTGSDANNGCFWTSPGLMWTNFPSAYQDTNSQDSGPTFVMSVGTPNAASLQEGVMYTTRWGYFQWGNETVPVGQTITHKGAVTSKHLATPFCAAMYGTFGEAACWYNVDQTNITAPLLWN